MPRCHRSLAEPYDPDLSRVLVAYIVTGVGFMLLPGTLVGVLNLLTTLPVSAVIEMTAVLLFAVNMLMTLTTGSPLEAYLESQRQAEALAKA